MSNTVGQGTHNQRRRERRRAARYVHWGATSQDVIDTATMLTLRAAIDALFSDIDRAIAGFATLATRHRHTAPAHLSADKLTNLFEPMAYQGVSQALIDRLLVSLEDK
jgi:Lyase